MEKITISAQVNAPVEKVWQFYTLPQYITQWNNASDDWHTPKADNDLRVGGRFLNRMESRDGTQGFDLSGIYDEVIENNLIGYTLDDGRTVTVIMMGDGDTTEVIVTFDAEQENPIELQKNGWQAILNNFKSFVEANLNSY